MIIVSKNAKLDQYAVTRQPGTGQKPVAYTVTLANADRALSLSDAVVSVTKEVFEAIEVGGDYEVVLTPKSKPEPTLPVEGFQHQPEPRPGYAKLGLDMTAKKPAPVPTESDQRKAEFAESMSQVVAERYAQVRADLGLDKPDAKVLSFTRT